MTARRHHGPARVPTAHRAGLAGLIGTTVEWYDFFIFSTAAGLVFPSVFFPDASPAAGLLASFATFWVGFVGRPLGAVVFGHLGDRHGRKRSLVTTLLLMGTATTAIGLLPGYASLGVAAPILLCLLRVVQGLAVGGEWGGAVLLAGEHAPPGRRVVFTAYAQQGTPLASILAGAVFIPFSRLSDTAFLSWGWRVPFLLSAVLLAIGLVIRLKVAESPEFVELSGRGTVATAPVRTALRAHSWPLVLCMGASAVPIAATYLQGTFVLSWATDHVGFPRDTVLTVMLCAAVGRFLVQPVAALAAGRLGTVPVYALGLASYGAAIPVNLVCLNTGSVIWITVGVGLLELTSAIVYAVVAALLTQAFPARVRYTGISLSQQWASVLFGGTAPMMAQLLTSPTVGRGALWPVAVYQAVLAAFSACCLLALARRRTDTPRALPKAVPDPVGGKCGHDHRGRR